MKVKETHGVARANEMIHNGIPVARESNLTDVAGLQIKTGPGTPVAAQFEALSRWGGGKYGSNPIQWLLATFPASAAADGEEDFVLDRGVNPAPSVALSIVQDGARVTVDTGVARFVVSKARFSVFEEATLVNGGEEETIVHGSSGFAQIEIGGHGIMAALPPEEVACEHQGPLFTTVKVAGHFDNPPPGGAAFRYIARYSFKAGSSTVDLDFYFAWPGSLTGEDISSLSEAHIGWTGDPRDRCLLVNRVRLSLPLALSAPWTGYVSGTEAKALSGALAGGESARLAQQRRSAMNAPASFGMALGVQSEAGDFASLPFVAVAGSEGGMGATIHQMRCYEPQSLEVSNSSLTIDVVSEPQWLAPFMGGYAKAALVLLPTGSNLPAASHQTAAALDHGLVAWPAQDYVARSRCLGELWDGTPSAAADAFMAKVQQISDNTFSGYIDSGMHGFMTYGVGPRYWDSMYQEFGDETNLWDGYFFGATFTDYHHTYSNVTRQFALTGDAELLYTLAFPAARRMLNTQIVQVNPGNPGYFGGWAPIGYNAYRKDDNSSHSYFENLFYYYYLTGDRQVIDTLLPAGEHKRAAYTRNTEGDLVPPQEPSPAADWAICSGRVGSQTANIFWFLGHASEDESYLDDFVNVCERFVTRFSALLNANGKEYAFSCDTDIASNPGTATSMSFWMAAMCNLNDIWKIYLDYGDVPLGPDGVTISRFYRAHQRAYWDYAATIHAGGDGTAEGVWADHADITWNGPRVGGDLMSVAPPTVGETYLYFEDKGPLAALSYRAAALNGNDSGMRAQGREMFEYLFGVYDPAGKVWDKSAGLVFFLSHAALAYFANAPQGASQCRPEVWRRY